MDAKTVPSRAGEVLRWRTWMLELKATGAETDGQFTLMESTWGPSAGTDAHVHSREDEAFFVLMGSVTILVGDERVSSGPGTLVLAPRDRPHGFTAGTDGARLLHLFTPGGIEGFFREWHAATEQTPQRIARLRKRYGMTSLGRRVDPN